jgi:hypothetical protein
MQHFKNYLDETHPNRSPDGRDADSPAAHAAHAAHAPASAGEDGGEGVYVRKWMRTRHSIIFRMSNNSFQVPRPRPAPGLLSAGRRAPSGAPRRAAPCHSATAPCRRASSARWPVLRQPWGLRLACARCLDVQASKRARGARRGPDAGERGGRT